MIGPGYLIFSLDRYPACATEPGLYVKLAHNFFSKNLSLS